MKRNKIISMLLVLVLVAMLATLVLTACEKCPHVDDPGAYFRNDVCTLCGEADPDPKQEISVLTGWAVGSDADAEAYTVAYQNGSRLSFDYNKTSYKALVSQDIGLEKDLDMMNTLSFEVKGTATSGPSTLMIKFVYSFTKDTEGNFDASTFDEYNATFTGTATVFEADLTHRDLVELRSITIIAAPGAAGAGNVEFTSFKLKRAAIDLSKDINPTNDVSSTTSNTFTKGFQLESQYTVVYNDDGSADFTYNKGAGATYSNFKTKFKGTGVPSMKKFIVAIQGTRGEKIIIKPFNRNDLEKPAIFTGGVDTFEVSVEANGFTPTGTDLYDLVFMARPAEDNVSGSFKIISIVMSSEPVAQPVLAENNVWQPVAFAAGARCDYDGTATGDDAHTDDALKSLTLNANGELVLNYDYSASPYAQQWFLATFDGNIRLLNGAQVRITFTASAVGAEFVVKPYDNGAQGEHKFATTGAEQTVTTPQLIGHSGNKPQMTFFLDPKETGATGTLTIHSIELFVSDPDDCDHIYDSHGECTICHFVCEAHDWDNEDGECAECGVTHSHDYDTDHECKTCGYEHPTTTHTYEDGDCTICGHEHSPHDWSSEDGECTECGYHCEHTFGTDGLCTICGFECPEHTFEDGVCTNCGYKCAHEWEEDGCALCDLELPYEADLNGLTWGQNSFGAVYHDEVIDIYGRQKGSDWPSITFTLPGVAADYSTFTHVIVDFEYIVGHKSGDSMAINFFGASNQWIGSASSERKVLAISPNGTLQVQFMTNAPAGVDQHSIVLRINSIEFYTANPTEGSTPASDLDLSTLTWWNSVDPTMAVVDNELVMPVQMNGDHGEVIRWPEFNTDFMEGCNQIEIEFTVLGAVSGDRIGFKPFDANEGFINVDGTRQTYTGTATYDAAKQFVYFMYRTTAAGHNVTIIIHSITFSIAPTV